MRPFGSRRYVIFPATSTVLTKGRKKRRKGLLGLIDKTNRVHRSIFAMNILGS